MFFNDEMIDMLVVETNRYAQETINRRQGTFGPHSRLTKWEPVTKDEMVAFIALLLLIGISNKRSSYDLYWSTHPLLEMKGFREVVTRDRFYLIFTCFHIVDNSTALPKGHPRYDKAWEVRPLISKLVRQWQTFFYPHKEVIIDESMIPFKGRTDLMQYMPAKPTKWGLKAWGLADADSGYIWNWSLYLGKQPDVQLTHGLGYHVVTTLMAPLYDKGHVVYMDSFFSSPLVFSELANHQTGGCGTLRTNRIGAPEQVKRARPKAGDPPMTARDGHMLFISWQDRKLVNCITTVHSSQTFQKLVRSKRAPGREREVEKPVAVQMYSKFMGGIDRADKQMTYYVVLHRSTKWWKRLFFYLLEVTFCNALIIWKAVSPGRVHADKFRLAIIQKLLQDCDLQRPRRPGRPRVDPPLRLTGVGEHLPTINPGPLKNGRRPRLDCVVCSDRSIRRHQTSYICKKCNVAMCPFPCFERFHTLQVFKIDCSVELHS